MRATESKEYPKGLERTSLEALQTFIRDHMPEDDYSEHPALVDVWAKCSDLMYAIRPLMPQSTACKANDVIVKIIENVKFCMTEEGEIGGES